MKTMLETNENETQQERRGIRGGLLGSDRRSLRRNKKNQGGPILIPGDDYDVYLETLSPTASPVITPAPIDAGERVSSPPSKAPVSGGSPGSPAPAASSVSPAPVTTVAPAAPTASPTPAPASTPTNTPTSFPTSSNPTPGPSESNSPTAVVTTATCENLVSARSDEFVFRYWIDLSDVGSVGLGPTDGDREATVEALEPALLNQMASTLLACENAGNANLGITTLDYLPKDTLFAQQEECPPFLDNCFVYQGFMGISIEGGADMDAAIQAARNTIESLMEANSFGVTLLENIEYLGPPFSNADPIERGAPPPPPPSASGGGLTAGQVVGIGLASFAVAMFVGFLLVTGRRREEEDLDREMAEIKDEDAAALDFGPDHDVVADTGATRSLGLVAGAAGMATGRTAYKHKGRTVYEWEQSADNVTIFVKAPPNIQSQDQLRCNITASGMQLGLAGAKRWFMNEQASGIVNVDESTWNLEDDGEGGKAIVITLGKAEKGVAWDSALKGPNRENLERQTSAPVEDLEVDVDRSSSELGNAPNMASAPEGDAVRVGSGVLLSEGNTLMAGSMPP